MLLVDVFAVFSLTSCSDCYEETIGSYFDMGRKFVSHRISNDTDLGSSEPQFGNVFPTITRITPKQFFFFWVDSSAYRGFNFSCYFFL